MAQTLTAPKAGTDFADATALAGVDPQEWYFEQG